VGSNGQQVVPFGVGGQRGNLFQGQLSRHLAGHNDIEGSCRVWVGTTPDSEFVEKIHTASGPIAGNVEGHSTVWGYMITG